MGASYPGTCIVDDGSGRIAMNAWSFCPLYVYLNNLHSDMGHRNIFCLHERRILTSSHVHDTVLWSQERGPETGLH